MFATQIQNPELFYKLVADSITKTQSSKISEDDQKRWINAIGKAVAKTEEQGEFLHYDETDTHLIIFSNDSNKIYSANGICQCAAYERNNPCWHRAAARLFRIYFEVVSEGPPLQQSGGGVFAANIAPLPSAWVAAAVMDNAPYIKTEAPSEKMGAFRI